MLQGHVFHSFARPELRESGPYVISQFIGGIAPAIFLFLTGVTFAFLMHGMERRAASARDRVITALRRAGYLGLLAFAFRIQLFLFGAPHSPAADLLKVDILNCMAFCDCHDGGICRVEDDPANPRRSDRRAANRGYLSACLPDSSGHVTKIAPHVPRS